MPIRLKVQPLSDKGFATSLVASVDEILAKKLRGAKKDIISEMYKLDQAFRDTVADVIYQGYFTGDYGGNVATRELINHWEQEAVLPMVTFEGKNRIEIDLTYFSDGGPGRHGEYLTRGRAPGGKLPPFEAIRDWAAVKFPGDLLGPDRIAKAIIFGKIRQDGIRPRPYLKKAAERFRRRKAFRDFALDLGPIFKRAR